MRGNYRAMHSMKNNEIALCYACMSKGQHTYLHINGERMSLFQGYKDHETIFLYQSFSPKKCDGAKGTKKNIFADFVITIVFFYLTLLINIFWVHKSLPLDAEGLVLRLKFSFEWIFLHLSELDEKSSHYTAGSGRV